MQSVVGMWLGSAGVPGCACLRLPACWCVLQLKPEPAPKGRGDVPFDATLVLGRPGQKAPGILFLHGGPHTAYSAAYLHALAFLASLGYNLVVPNYRCCMLHTLMKLQQRQASRTVKLHGSCRQR